MDAVFSLAVLEHVGDPQQVVREMMRVLKPGGVLDSQVPFIFFFHGYPSDYTRFNAKECVGCSPDWKAPTSA